MGHSLWQDAQSPSRLLQQDGSTPDDFGTGVPVCSTEVATLDHEHNLLNNNLQSTLLHNPVNGIVPHGGTSSVPQVTSQFRTYWMTSSGSLHPTDRSVLLQPSSLWPTSFLDSSICPTSVSDFSNSPSSAQDPQMRPWHPPASICSTSILDSQVSSSTQNFSLSAMSLNPASLSNFTGNIPALESLQPGLFSDFTQAESSQLSINPASDDLMSSQAFHADITESPPHIPGSVHGSPPITALMVSQPTMSV